MMHGQKNIKLDHYIFSQRCKPNTKHGASFQKNAHLLTSHPPDLALIIVAQLLPPNCHYHASALNFLLHDALPSTLWIYLPSN